MKVEIKFKLLPKQKEFLTSKSEETIYLGPYACGKTVALNVVALKYATIPNNNVLLVRKMFNQLKETTLQSLINEDICGNNILPQSAYTYNRATQIISLHGGGRIFLVGCDTHLNQIGAMNADCICIDNVEELMESEYDVLRNRLRGENRRGYPIFSTANRIPRCSWMHKIIYHSDYSDRDVKLIDTNNDS